MKNCLLILICIACASVCARSQCTTTGNQTNYGINNVWRGYVYNNTNFSSYAGRISEGNSTSPNFDEDFGGDYVNFATTSCNVYSETFSVRFKLTKSFASGYYEFTVGGDDGYRLSVNGGSTWLIDAFTDHSYNTTVATVYLSGSTDLVLEYYENSSNNRVSFSLQPACVGSDDPNVYGTGNIWRGYVYAGTAFNTFKGTVTRGNAVNPFFDESFGGDAVNYGTNSCTVYTEAFSVRYRLTKTFNNVNAVFLIGGDDGYRFSLDGGTTWVIDQWNDHSYAVSSYTANLNGTYNMVLEYYENGGGNRVSFDVSMSTLPIRLLQFNGERKDDQVNLNWTTTANSNTDHFIVERSADGQQFAPIAEVQASASAQYHYTDISPLSGNSFYRLQMADDNNVITYSNVVTMKSKTDAALKIFPTLLQGRQSLSLQTGKLLEQATLTICDMAGRPMLQQSIAQLRSGQLYPVPLPIQRLAKGIYLVQVRNASGVLLNQKILLE